MIGKSKPDDSPFGYRKLEPTFNTHFCADRLGRSVKLPGELNPCNIPHGFQEISLHGGVLDIF
jgi:hypothetical protein